MPFVTIRSLIADNLSNLDDNGDLISGDDYLREKHDSELEDSVPTRHSEKLSDLVTQLILMRLAQPSRTMLSSMSVARVFRLSSRDAKSSMMNKAQFFQENAEKSNKVVEEDVSHRVRAHRTANTSYFQEAVNDYKKAFRNWKGMSPEYRSLQIAKMYDVQMKSVIIPGAIVNHFAGEYDLSETSIALINTVLSSGLMVWQRDPATRFNAINAYVSDPGSRDLFTITKEEYRGDYEELQRRIDTYRYNAPYQRIMYSIKIAGNAASIYTSRPAAKAIVSNLEDVIEQSEKLTKDRAEDILTYGFRAGWSVSNNIADRLLSLASVGTQKYEEVHQEFLKDLKSFKLTDFRRLRAGGAAGMASSLIKVTILADGPKLYRSFDKMMKEVLSEETTEEKPGTSVSAPKAKKTAVAEEQKSNTK